MDVKTKLKKVPEVNIRNWNAVLWLGMSQCVVDTAGPRGNPAVFLTLCRNPRDVLANPQTAPRKYIHGLMVYGELHNDGVVMHFVARPDRNDSPSICMKFKEWRPERAMAAIMAVMAYHAEKPRLPKKFKLADEWLRKMRDRILKHFYRNADGFESLGMQPAIIETERLCFQRFNSLAGLDVKESLDRVKKEFKLLTDHMNEEEVLAVWRETVIDKVMKS